MFFFWSRSRDQDEFWATNINDQRTFFDTMEAWLRFVLWTPVKSSNQEPRNGAIKQSRTIFIDQDSWSQSQMLLWAKRMWLPLEILECPCDFLPNFLACCMLATKQRFPLTLDTVSRPSEEHYENWTYCIVVPVRACCNSSHTIVTKRPPGI